MIRCFRPNIIEKGAEFEHQIKGQKEDEEVAKKKNQEAENCTCKKHTRIAEALPQSRKGTP